MTDVLSRADLSRTVSHRAFVAASAFALGVAATVVVPRLTDDTDAGPEIGETFEAEVESYFDESGPEPNLICLDGDERGCGRPLFADETAPDVQPGDRVRATEVWLWHDGSARLAYYVEPLE